MVPFLFVKKWYEKKQVWFSLHGSSLDKLEALRITILETVEIEVGNILGNTYKIVIDVMDRKVSIWKKLHR